MKVLNEFLDEITLNGVINGLGIMGFVFAAALANVLGGMIVLFKKDWSRRGLHALMALSAGLLMAIAIGDLIPESLSYRRENSSCILLGILTIFFFQQFVSPHFHFGEETHRHKKMRSAAWGHCLACSSIPFLMHGVPPTF